MKVLASFTAAEIAIALGAQRQAVQRVLAAVPEAGTRLVRGNAASTWKIASLPRALAGKLERRARAKGFRSIEHLLSDPPRRFEARVPVNQLSEQTQQRAMKLRKALALPLTDQAGGRKGAALVELGLREYRRIFGFEIEERHWRRLLSRTIDRDAGEEQWSRLDLYIDERPRATAPASRAPSSETTAIREAEKILLGYAEQVRSASSPTTEEKAMLWQTAFDQAAELAQAGVKASRARLAMRRALWKCGVTLAKNEGSLGQLWRVKEEKWNEHGGHLRALLDQREKNSGYHRAPELPQKDVDQVIARAVRCGGRISQAWREVLEERLVSPATLAYYEGLEPASKSYVPRRIREAARNDVRLLQDIHHGPRRSKLNGAYINRDWSGVAAGDLYQADDWTPNAYFVAPDERGKPTLMRGQVLLFIDVRSTFILGFAMIDARNYNAHAIRTLITKVCSTHGMPRKGFYFERGIWENSRLLVGDRKAEALSWIETETGLRELGLVFNHSNLPRSKPVERVIGELQNLLDGIPGDAGRREMTDGFERLQRQKRLVESGQHPASDFFLSHAQMQEEIATACGRVNNQRNDGKMTCGRTPAQAWVQFQSDPLSMLPKEALYLLAHHKRPITVGRNGITLRFGKNNYAYRNRETGRLIGQQVLAWFNPEIPDLLAVTDMNRKNPFTVERVHDVPAMDASPEVLAQAMAGLGEHNGYARTRYQMLASKIRVPIRANLIDRPTADLGRAIESQAAESQQLSRVRKTRESKARTVLNSLGYAARPGEEFTDDQIEGAVALKKLLSGEES
jgi:hypothetical protein